MCILFFSCTSPTLLPSSSLPLSYPTLFPDSSLLAYSFAHSIYPRRLFTLNSRLSFLCTTHSGTALRWFASYLSNRQQGVVLEGAFSDWLPVTSGVPQGSILGPLLFLVFPNEMPSYVHLGSSLALLQMTANFNGL